MPECLPVCRQQFVHRLGRDIPPGGDTVEVVVRRRRMVCTEAANSAIKHIERTGRGYRNHPAFPGPYPAAQPSADTAAAYTLESAGHHGELRVSRNGGA
jgi:hypothetical protein